MDSLRPTMVILNVLPLNVLVITLFLATGAAAEGKWAISLAGCPATVLAAVALRWWMRYWGWDSRDAWHVYVLVGILGILGFVEGMKDEGYALSTAFLASVIAAIGLAEWLRRRDPYAVSSLADTASTCASKQRRGAGSELVHRRRGHSTSARCCVTAR